MTIKTHSFSPAALLTLILVVVLAGLTRFGHPGTVEFKHDEATLSLLALDWLDGGPFPLTGMPSSVGVPNAPASVYVMAIPYGLGLDAQGATMFIAALNVMGVGLLWLIAYRYLGFVPALVAGLVHALNPWAVLYSRKIWAQDFHTPLLLLALLLGLHGFLEGKRWAQVLCLPLLLFALQIHFAAWVLLPLYLWLLIAGRKQLSLWALTASLLLGILVMLPFAAGIAQTLSRESDRLSGLVAGIGIGPDAVIYTAGLATGTGVRAEIAPGHAIGFPDLTSLWLAVLGGAVLLGLARSWRRGWRLAGFVGLWALLPLLVFTLQWTVVYPHYFIASIPAYALLAGIGLDIPTHAGRETASRALRIAYGLIVALFCMVPLSQGLYWQRLMAEVATTYTPEGFGTPLSDLLAVRDALTDTRDVVVLTDGIEMQLDQEPVIWTVLLHDTADCVRALSGDGRALFPAAPFAVLTAPNAPENPINDLYTSADAQRFRLRPREGRYTVTRFDSPPLWTAPVMTSITPVQFDNGATLTGYHLEPNQAYLEWTFAGPTAHDNQFFVHFLDAGGERVAQRDDRFWPGRYWCAGDRLIMWTDVEVPETAQTLRVGLYTLEPGGGFTNAQVLDVNGTPVGPWVDIPLE
ncbi:MAG: hypothetical protein K8L99_34410 [Anaerolineae bacterium]|nr:hypothetical protein [Anaerolineae bacterium]